MRKRTGDNAGSETIRKVAADATTAIVNPLSRVWMFGDLASADIKVGEIDPAWVSFKDGLKVTEGLRNTWARARALGRLGAVMGELAWVAADARRD